MKVTTKLNEYVLHLDFDYPIPKRWMEVWREEKIAMLERLGFKVTDIIVKPSPSKKKGRHIWVHMVSPRRISEDYINMLQWLCLDDGTRVWINRLRTRRGLKVWWNKLFDHHIWKKPLPKICRKCRLRRILNEMRKVELKGDDYE